MSVNQNLKPLTTERRGSLYIGGCDLTELAKIYGTPLYVVDEATLRQICKEYKEAFSDYKNINLTYASKALCTIAVSKILYEEGFGFDAVSAGEIYTIKQAGADTSKITFNGNNKTEEEIEYALEARIGRFSVDNRYELSLLNKLAEQKEITVNVLLRTAPGIECHTHEYIKTGQLDSKFGFGIEELDDIIKLIITEYSHIKIKGLHAHIGSQIFELKSFGDEIDILVKTLAKLNNKFSLEMNELNIGGGLGVKYVENDIPPSVNDFASVVKSAVIGSSKKYGTELPVIYIEPGRSIISPACVTLYKIGSEKLIPNIRKYVTVDGGMADNPRPAMYNAEYLAEIANDVCGRSCENVSVAGRYCESGDILIKNISLPSPKSGDILCVYNTGAYNYSMASNYNKVAKPAMVLVNNSQSDIIVNRESFEDLIRLECIPDRLKR